MRKKGFSLFELMMVLAIASSISFMRFQDLKKEQENVLAHAVGQQIKQIGSAVNGYINIHYDKLSTLTSVSTGTGTDPGPRTCSTTASTCIITYQTLINEGLLPSSFNGINANRSGYDIILKRQGTSPNYLINGLITTNNTWVEGGKVRYDLLGKAMQSAGVDSGMSKTSTTVSGYAGTWNEQSSKYTTINKTGLLGYRVGYDSAMYSVFLRRDGTLPMTGDLNMGGQNINNTKNISASGTTISGTLKSIGETSVGTDLTVSGISNLKGATNISNNLTVTGNEKVNGTLVSNSRITGKEIYSNSETYTTNWFRTMGDGGIYFQKYGGGWNMTNTSTINAYGGKNVQTTGGFYGGYLKSTGNIDATGNITSSGQVKGSTLVSTGRSTVGEFIQINGVASAGNRCSPNGLQGRANTGVILSCVNGVWTSAGLSSSSIYYGAVKCDNKNGQSIAYCPAGTKLLSGGHVLTSWRNDDGRNSPDSSYPDASSNAWHVSPPGKFGGCMKAVALCSH